MTEMWAVTITARVLADNAADVYDALADELRRCAEGQRRWLLGTRPAQKAGNPVRRFVLEASPEQEA